MDHGRGANGIKIAGLGVVDARFALCDNDNSFILAERIDKLNGAFPPYGKRQGGVREQNRIPHREHGQGPYVIYFSMLSKWLGKRLVAHWALLECNSLKL